MSFLGMIPFIIAIIAFIFAFKHFTKFFDGAWRRSFSSKHLALFFVSAFIFLSMFYIMAEYHEELGIKSSCARSADCFQQNS